MADGVRVEVEGLKETLRFLGRIDSDLRKEAVDVLRDATKKVQAESRSRLASTPGVRRSSYPVGRGAIIRSASGKGAAVGISRASSAGRNAAIFGAEFGAHTWHVPRGNVRRRRARGISQGRMKRRTFPVWRGNSSVIRGSSGPGWIVLPTLRKWLPRIEKEMARDLDRVVAKGLRAAGVPRG